MRISMKLRVATVAVVFAAIVITFSLIYSYWSIDRVRRNGDIVRQIRTRITELNHISFSYITHREDRPKQQFLSEYDALIKLISSTRLKDKDQQALLNDILVNCQEMEDLFFKLIANNDLSNSVKNGGMAKAEIEERLIGQLMSRSYIADSKASFLRSLTDRDIWNSLRRSVILVLIVFVLAIIPFAIFLARTSKDTVESLNRLGQGAKIIGTGNLDYTIDVKHDDEIGELSRVFNQMTENLKVVTTSRADLEKEVMERAKAEASLKQSEDRLQKALSIGNSFVFEWNPATDEVVRSESCSAILGLTGDEIMYDKGKTFFKRVHKDDIERFAAVLDGLNPTNRTYHTEYRVVRNDGTVVELEETAEGFFDGEGNLQRVIGTTLDVTERKRVEKELLLASQQLEMAYRASGVGTWDWDVDRCNLVWSSHMFYLFGLDPQRSAASFETWNAILHQDDREMANENINRVLQNHTPLATEYRIIRPDNGEIRWINALGEGRYDDQGKRVQMAGICIDVTTRKKIEEALKKNIDRLDIISNTASQLLFSADPQKIINTLCERVMKHLDCDVFFNFLVDEKMNCLRLNAYAGIEDETARQIHLLDYGVAVCGCVARDACRIVAENIPTTPDVRTDLVRSFGIKAYACHPLIVEGQVIGTLSFGTRSRLTFAEDELSLMKTVADQVAIAMERIRLLRSERERTDELEHLVRKRTAQLNQQAELLNLAHDAIILSDMSGKIIFWSAGAEDTYKFSRNEAVGNITHDILQTKSQMPIKDILDIVKREGHWEGELVHTCKEGRKVTVHSRWALRQNEVDGTTEIMEVNRDITSRKQFEEAVKDERERLYSVLETLPAYVALMTRDYRMTFANRVFRELFGDPEGRQCFRHLFKRTEPCEVCETFKVFEANEPQRWQWTGPNGRIYDIYDFPFTDIDGFAHILEMGIDITERKQAEDEVRFANAYNRSLIEASPDPLVTISAEGLITDVNAATENVTGYSRHELIGTDFSNYFTDHDKAKEGYEQVFREGIVRDYELEILHSSGYVTPVLYNASVYRNNLGVVLGVFAAARDISVLRSAEQALRESEERYRIAIESASDGIVFMKDGCHVFANRRFAEIFGYDDPNEIIGQPLSVTVHPDDLHMVSELNRLRQEGESVTSRYEFRGIKKDGTVRIIEVSAAESNYLGESVSLAYLRDITDYKNLEEQLRHSQKMEAMGVLAGGIAHDFNNILAAIIGFAEMIEEDIPLGKPKVQHAQRVINAASRGRELVQQILAFSRKTEHARHPVSLSAIAKETAQLLRASIPTTIDIILNITATSDIILATPVEVQQILMNLATNAALSMQEKGGVLRVNIEHVCIDPHSPFLEAEMVPGEYLKLEVGDTGSGMTHEVMERIFEPFFTTREVGQGTGMGLAVVYGIVKSLNGSIRVESEPGVGSTFSVYLPKTQDNAQTEKFISELSPGGKERVLFVDDEEFLVEWGKALLERLGYEVVAMNDSKEALKAFSSEPGVYDLVITDQTMPGITGLQLAGEIRRIRPEIPIILCTGHSNAVTYDKLEEAGIREFLVKPLSRKELSEAIRRVLDNETKK